MPELTVLEFVVNDTVALVRPFKLDMVVMFESAFLQMILKMIAITVISQPKKAICVA